MIISHLLIFQSLVAVRSAHL